MYTYCNPQKSCNSCKAGGGGGGGSLVNQTVFRERACASERGEGKEKYGLAKLARFSRPRQDLVVTNQIADPA